MTRGSLNFDIRSEIKCELYVFHLNTNEKRKTENRETKKWADKNENIFTYIINNNQHISYMYLHIQLINHGEKHGRQCIANNYVSERRHNTHLFPVYAEQ